MRLKRETQGAFCVLNANAKSQTRKSMKINVICTVLHNLSVLGLCVQINDSGLFAWISLTFCLGLILPMKFGKVEYLLR